MHKGLISSSLDISKFPLLLNYFLFLLNIFLRFNFKIHIFVDEKVGKADNIIAPYYLYSLKIFTN